MSWKGNSALYILQETVASSFVSLAISPRIIRRYWGDLAQNAAVNDRSSAYRKSRKHKSLLNFINPCKMKGNRVSKDQLVMIFIFGPINLVTMNFHSAIAITVREEDVSAWVANIVTVIL